jgi:hypothetical protein
MRTPLIHLALAVAGAGVTLYPGPVQAAGEHGEVVLSDHGTVLQKQSPPPLALSDSQRQQVRQAVDLHGTSQTLTSKTTKSAKDFAPSIGAQIPPGFKPHSLPRPLIYKIPVLRSYEYVKFKEQVLIVDPMKHTIVDMFPLQAG